MYDYDYPNIWCFHKKKSVYCKCNKEYLLEGWGLSSKSDGAKSHNEHLCHSYMGFPLLGISYHSWHLKRQPLANWSWQLSQVECNNLWPHLTVTCVYLWWLEMICIHFEQAQVWAQANTSFSPSWPPNLHCKSMEVIVVLRTGMCTRLFFQFVLNLPLLVSPFGHPLQVCLYKSAIPDLHWLVTSFGQGFRFWIFWPIWLINSLVKSNFLCKL